MRASKGGGDVAGGVGDDLVLGELLAACTTSPAAWVGAAFLDSGEEELALFLLGDFGVAFGL